MSEDERLVTQVGSRGVDNAQVKMCACVFSCMEAPAEGTVNVLDSGSASVQNGLYDNVLGDGISHGLLDSELVAMLR